MENKVFEVKDGTRVLQFNGKLLAKSSSWRAGSTRWIEFELYRTENGSYILSRVGVSLIYHTAACPLVKRYGLREVPSTDIVDDALPCDTCRPPDDPADLPVAFPETNRYWAQVSEEPDAVLEALYKYDQGGARYLTKVAERLLEQAAPIDKGIQKIYSVEVIP
jgi:hypothetical protein